MDPDLANWVAASVGAPIERVAPLRVEASHRRFYRIWMANTEIPSKRSSSSAVVMASPPELERNDAFVAMQRLFSGARLPVPEIIAMDTESGYFLLSDLGARHLEEAYGGPDERRALEQAIANLVRIQAVEAQAVAPYEESRLRDELGIFSEWFLGSWLGETPDPGARSAFEALIDNALGQPQCLIHRDYHCRNLLLDGDGRLGLVDFQDALIGPATYDLACLLWDCYHTFEEGTLRRWQERYRVQSRFDFTTEVLARALDLTGLQRQFKAVGIFARLWLRDGKASHLGHIVPVLATMRRIVGGYAETRHLSGWLQRLQGRAAAALKASAP
ncbi:MAG: phosphotransferase [Gammaproteobacteria bacterium]|nr:phosphotransferase [Gammaproteobacteria bacterium]